MHLCTAHIALGGDQGNVMVRGAHKPVSWPEVGLLQFIHGEENVYNIEVVSETKTSAAAEKNRLAAVYGQNIADLVYPGRSPSMEMEMPGTSLSDKGSKKAHTREPKRSIIPPLEDNEV